MTEEEKGFELIREMRAKLWASGVHAGVLEEAAKQCAIIAVEEVMAFAFGLPQYEFWKQVKQSLQTQ